MQGSDHAIGNGGAPGAAVLAGGADAGGRGGGILSQRPERHRGRALPGYGLFASGADENYNIIFDIDERYALDALTPENPLLVKMTFFGDLPSYGFSFDDETGKTRYFSISLSGYDGSIIVNEFSNAQ